MVAPVPGDLAFVGPAHVKELTDFQYVELDAVDNGIATVKVVGADEDDDGRLFFDACGQVQPSRRVSGGARLVARVICRPSGGFRLDTG
jgi:hypothetical protein